MTKTENDKCIKLMNEGIEYGKSAKFLFSDLNNLTGNTQNIAELKAQNYLGCAQGINQVLVSIGFKNESMKELSRLI